MADDLNPDLAALWGEIRRQERNYPGTMPDKLLTSLGEEFGEVCRALGRDLPLGDEHGALHELLQLAAVAMRGRAALLYGSYGLPYHHEGGNEHRHDGVTDIHEGGARWHVAHEDTDDPRDDGPYSAIADGYMRQPQ